MEALLPLVLVGSFFFIPIVWMFVRRQRAEAAMRAAAEKLGGRVAELERKGFFEPGLEIKADVDERRVKIGMRLSKRRCTAKVKITRGPVEMIRFIPSASPEARAMLMAYANNPEMALVEMDGVLLPPIQDKRGVKFLKEQAEVLALFRELEPAHLMFMMEDVSDGGSGDISTTGYVEVVLNSRFIDSERLAQAGRLAILGAQTVEAFPRS